MKTVFTFTLVLVLAACTPEFIMNPSMPDPSEITQQNQVLDPLYDESGNLIPDFVPALQPFVNEGCNTAWANVSGIVNPNGSVTYFTSLPAWTADSTDYDKDRFTFIFQAQNPWYGVFEGEEPYAQIGSPSWYTLPIDDYGVMTCEGLQEIRTWVLDELTGTWYMNSQICWAALLCNGQVECNQGWSFDQIEYTPYTGGYIHVSSIPISNY